MITIDSIEFNSFKEAIRYLQLQANICGNELTEDEAKQLILDEYLEDDFSSSIKADESLDDLISAEYSEVDLDNDFYQEMESELVFED